MGFVGILRYAQDDSKNLGAATATKAKDKRQKAKGKTTATATATGKGKGKGKGKNTGSNYYGDPVRIAVRLCRVKDDVLWVGTVCGVQGRTGGGREERLICSRARRQQ
jgi:hypothetical protein